MSFGCRLAPLARIALVLSVSPAPFIARAAIETTAFVPRLQTITNTAQFRTLSRVQANQGWPLRLEGVVTLTDSNRRLLVLQDAQGALALHLPFDGREIRPGLRIRVESDKAAGIAQAFPEYPLRPSASEWLPTFSAPTNRGGSYLARMHGFLTAPVTGDYKFWIASKGASELWLSTNADSANLQLIAFLSTGRWVSPGQWGRFPTQASGPIHLNAGQSCLVDVLHEQRAGRDDTVAVAWQGPGIPRSVIEGRFLVPYSNTRTNGIIREHWDNYFLAAVQPLTSGENADAELEVTSPRIEVLGDSAFPDPVSVGAGASVSLADNYRWVEVEGSVGFVAVDHDVLTLELVDGPTRTRLKVPGWTEPNPIRMQGARLRARGVCEAVLDGNGSRTAGIIWVPSAKELSEIEIGRGDPDAFKAVSIGELNPANPSLALGRRIRVRGTVLHKTNQGFVVEGTGSFCGYVSTNGLQWKPVGSPIDIPMRDSALAGLSVSSASSEALATALFDSVAGVGPTAQDLEIGDALPAGRTTVRGGRSYTIQGGGTGFGPARERLHFYGQPLATNGEIIAQVNGLESGNAQATAGVMIRDSVDPAASFVGLTLRAGGGATLHFRQGLGEGHATVDVSGCPVPCWLKLTRRYPQVEIRTESAVPVNAGEGVEMAGWLQWEGTRPVLARAHRLDDPTRNEVFASSNVLQGATDFSGALPRVQIAQLLPEEGQGPREGSGSVCVRGVVTFSGQAFGSNYLVLQDESAGALVRLNGRFARRPLEVGKLVELQLRSQNGKWPLPLFPIRIEVMGKAQMPAPANYPASSGLIGREESLWVECDGVVREVAADGGLMVMCKEGVMPIWVSETTKEELSRYVDSLVRVRGALVRAGDRLALLTPSMTCLEVLEAAPETPFAIPSIAISDLNAFDHPTATLHRVKVSGVVTYRGNNFLVVQDGSGAVRITSVSPADLLVGDSVEAVGFPDMQAGFPVLSEGLARKSGTFRLPAPVQTSPAELESGSHSAQLIQLSGELVKQQVEGRSQILELRVQQQVFRASLVNSPNRLPAIPEGSKVEVTGICWAERVGGTFPRSEPNELKAASFEVLLRTPRDVAILQRPPWWVWKHAGLIISSLGLVLTAALLWIRFLRRKVVQRTYELEAAMTKLGKETATSAILAERNRLAGEIHDSVEQGLSAIVMQMEAATKVVHQPEEVGRYLAMARNMAGFSRTEVQHAVWGLQSPMLEHADLGHALGRIASETNAGGLTLVAVAISGQARPLPSTVEHHLLRIGQEAITNAVKHGHPKKIDVALDYGTAAITLAVCDDGCGFNPEAVTVGSAHFGLQGLRSRARKLNAALTITSQPNRGTSVKVEVPFTTADFPANTHS